MVRGFRDKISGCGTGALVPLLTRVSWRPDVSTFSRGCLQRIWRVSSKTLPCITCLEAYCESVEIIALRLEAMAKAMAASSPLGGDFSLYSSLVDNSSIWCCNCRYHLSLLRSGGVQHIGCSGCCPIVYPGTRPQLFSWHYVGGAYF